jgi:ATP-dependent Zn protease
MDLEAHRGGRASQDHIFGGAMAAAWLNMLISWLPFLILFAFWLYFMKRMKSSRQPELVERAFQHYDRTEALLERIALTLERGETAGRSSSRV